MSLKAIAQNTSLIENIFGSAADIGAAMIRRAPAITTISYQT